MEANSKERELKSSEEEAAGIIPGSDQSTFVELLTAQWQDYRASDSIEIASATARA